MKHSIAIALLSLLLFPIANARGASLKIESPQAVIALLKSGDWKRRDQAVSYASSNALQDSGVRAAFIEALTKENEMHEKWYAEESAGKSPQDFQAVLGEGYGEYYGNLVSKVASLKDRAALNVLTSAEGGEQIAADQYGADAVPPLLARFQSTKNAFARIAIIRTLGKMANKGQLIGVLKVRSKDLIFNAASKDKNTEVRMSAVENLARFDRAEATKTLKAIAESDEHSFVRKADSATVYPVREAAKRELKRLEK